MGRYAKGAIDVDYMRKMPLDEYIILRNAIMELVRLEQQEIEESSKNWKK